MAPRSRKVRVLATLGPASQSPEIIATLFAAGADAFRINMSHGDQHAKIAVIQAIRSLERVYGRPTTILADLQGPKLRVGRFLAGRVDLLHGSTFVLDRDPAPGDDTRVELPHCEIFAAIASGGRLLLDDGKIVLRVMDHGSQRIVTRVEVGGALSNNKGLNVPDVVLPMAALTPKDIRDLAFVVDQGVDWIALSFVQRPEDLAEARKLIGGKAALLAKIEKPAAIDRLEEIIEACDGVMVARGDLGVELPPERVPPLQKRIVETARRLGRPVIVATQMLESMIASPSPTRAEVSDVATAIYDGADAIMLSAESAAGDWPVESVAMMDAIGVRVEADPMHGDRVHFTVLLPDATTADALAAAAKTIAQTVSATAIICFTLHGSTVRRVARERPSVPILALTPDLDTARRIGLVWGTHAVHTRDVASFGEMVAKAKRIALRNGIARVGDRVIIIAGVPFKTPGSTNVLHVIRLLPENAGPDPRRA
jgi:pyruvate kinase